MEEVLTKLLSDAPLALAAIYIARMYMQKHEQAMAKLVSVFEQEVKACEERYNMVFTELMKLKDKLAGL